MGTPYLPALLLFCGTQVVVNRCALHSLAEETGVCENRSAPLCSPFFCRWKSSVSRGRRSYICKGRAIYFGNRFAA
jgi:hypothetical protein